MSNSRDTVLAAVHRTAERRSSRPPAARAKLRPVPPTQPREEIDPSDLKNPALYINRELSWLEFNQRVLAQAQDTSHPLLERVKFLAIVANNLDEFFTIRVATSLKKLKAGIEDIAPDGLNTEQQLSAMRTRALKQLEDIANCWNDLRHLLTLEGIHFLEIPDWTPELREHLSSLFSRDMCPVLTPLAFDPGHPFPFMSNRSKNFAVVVKHGGRTKFARVKVPDTLSRFIAVPEALSPQKGLAFVFLEDVIRESLQQLFRSTQVKGAHLFRVLRDADLEVEEDEADDLLETVDRNLKQLRHGALSLLQVESGMPGRVLNILEENFETDEDVVVRTSDRLGFADWMQLLKIHRPQLKDAPYSPRVIWRTEEDPDAIFEELRYQDQLIHHPYESFSAIEGFVRAAAKDPQVIAIKMTLYRIGPNSPLVDLLIEAAEGGKQVAVLVEIKARGDERNNILWAQRLEEAGVHVVYGWASLKTHCKLCLVVRQEPDGIQRYVHTATGNYNPETSKIYTDIGLFTADPDIVADVSEIFNSLTGYSNQKDYRAILVAPVQLRNRLCELVMREAEHARAGRPARIIIKCNAITDDQMIRVLYRASQAGVSMDLIVRGICSLRPGIRGISDNIRVQSIVGRFLEHSRMYWFQNGGDEEMYIGSADLMERNLDRRVETLCPVRDADIRTHLRDVVLHAYLQDTDRAMVLDASGRYSRPPAGSDVVNAQRVLLEQYSRPRD